MMDKQIENIVEIEITKLVPAEYNPRRLTKKQHDDIKASLQKFGFVDPVIVNTHPDRQNVIIGGHQRVKVWESMGNDTVPCVLVTCDIKEEQELNVRLNKNTGEFDWDMLANHFEQADLIDWGFEPHEFGEIETLEPEETEGDDDVPESAPQITVIGDIYELGGVHRVMCGDSTMIDDVEKLMNHEKADMVFTDPPYGIGFKYNSHKDTTGDEYQDFCRDWFHNLNQFCEFIVISTGWAYNKFWYSYEPTDCFYWISKNKRTGGKISHFRKVEPIFIWGKPKKKYNMDFWEQTSEILPELKGKHTCPKPLSLVTAIIDESGAEDKVLDLFLGSGTTLIACEKTNRKCYGMELDPKYCDVIVKRYVEFCKANNRPYEVKRNGELTHEFQ